MSLRSLSNAHRADLVELTRLSGRDLSLVLRRFRTLDDTRDGLMETLPKLVAMYGSAAATLGADWYEEMRVAAGVTGRFVATAAELPDDDRTDILARWAVSPMFAPESEDTSFDDLKGVVLAKAAGGLQHIIANADRDSVRTSSVQDRHAIGWTRTTSGGCQFCDDLADGRVQTEAGADFKAHDHCHCLAAPVFG